MKGFAKTIKTIATTPKKRVAALYALALGLYLLVSLAATVFDYALPQHTLPLQAARMENLQPEGDSWYISTNADPQLHFTGLSTWVRRVVLQCRFEDVPGEIDLYYMRPGDADFSTSRRVWGRLLANGSYEFILPPGPIAALRVDPGSLAANRVALQGVLLNTAKPVWAYFAPSLRQLLALALWPALVHCVASVLLPAAKPKQSP